MGLGRGLRSAGTCAGAEQEGGGQECEGLQEFVNKCSYTQGEVRLASNADQGMPGRTCNTCTPPPTPPPHPGAPCSAPATPQAHPAAPHAPPQPLTSLRYRKDSLDAWYICAGRACSRFLSAMHACQCRLGSQASGLACTLSALHLHKFNFKNTQADGAARRVTSKKREQSTSSDWRGMMVAPPGCSTMQVEGASQGDKRSGERGGGEGSRWQQCSQGVGGGGRTAWRLFQQ